MSKRGELAEAAWLEYEKKWRLEQNTSAFAKARHAFNDGYAAGLAAQAERVREQVKSRAQSGWGGRVMAVGIGVKRLELLRLAHSRGYVTSADAGKDRRGRQKSLIAKLIQANLVRMDMQHYTATGESRYYITFAGCDYLQQRWQHINLINELEEFNDSI